MSPIHFGTESEFVRISNMDSSTSDAWLPSEVSISVNCFRGDISPYIQRIDFERFFDELVALHQSLSGSAELKPLEGQFELTITGNGFGHILISGEAWSRATYENKLVFEIEIDQTFLPKPIAQLAEFLSLIK